jgi:WD40 repeat protein
VARQLALSIGLAHFDRHDRLDFAPGLARSLASALADLGYDVKDAASESLPSAELGALVTETLHDGDSDGLAIVHVVSHGEDAEGGATVFALGSDGVRHGDASVAHWLTMHQDASGPTTLFLLDLCSAGTAARLPWQVRLDRPRGWVIAASAPGGTAYDGRFTQAVINVLRALGSLDVDPNLPYVPLATVARAIRREVNRLIAAEDSFAQQVVGSLVDITADAEPAFFPNPAYSPSPRGQLRAEVDPGVLPFLDDLDEGLDARHFIDRAAGLGGLGDGTMIGCFTGRDRELKRISPWLGGDGSDALCVVTGSPGAGKSALLGVLVCAASPELRAATRPIWDRVAQAPLPIDRLAAVHARQRGPAAVAASIARQLALPENLSTADLVAAARSRSAVIVVDALDEADDPVRLMEDLLLPLVADGAAVRVLVGVRSYDQFTPLLQRAMVVNLDEVDQEVLENDLYNYVSSLLRATATYRRLGGVVGAFAGATANRLAADEGGRWGPFLVAGLYTRHFVSAHAEVVTDPALAERLGREVPADLPGVLELDLDLRRDQPWLRPVLVALAHARGGGLPVSLLARVAPVFAPGTPSVSEVRAALTEGKFYVRQSLDTDHSNVYRLFHQGLADTLRSVALESGLLDAMLSPLGPAEARDWDAAEPYLFRHVVDHAMQAGRLAEIHDDPGLWLHPRFESTPELGAPAERFAGVTSAAELALAAARAGQPGLARRAANLPGHAPLTWQPRWTLGRPGPTSPAPVRPGPAFGQRVAISSDGSQLMALDDSGICTWVWRAAGEPEGEPVESPLPGHLIALSAHGEELLVGEGDQLHWSNGDVEKTATLSAPVAAAVRHQQGETWIAVTVDGKVVRFGGKDAITVVDEFAFRGNRWTVGADLRKVVAAALNTEGQLLVFAGTSVLAYPTSRPATAFALSRDGAHLAAGTADGWVGALRPSRDSTWRHDTRLPAGVTALAFAPDNLMLAAGTEDGSVHVIQAGELRWSVKCGTAAIRSVAISRSPVRVIAIDDDGTAYHVTSAGAGVLPAPARPASVAALNDHSLVTAFIVEEQVLVGWNNGDLLEVELTSGDPVNLTRPESGAIVDLLSTVVAGREAWLVETVEGYQLHCDGMPHAVTLPLSSRWAEERFRTRPTSRDIVRDGELVEVTIETDTVLVGDQVLGQHRGVRVVHCAYIDNQPTAFTGGSDGTVRVWDLSANTVTSIHIGRPVWSIRTAADGWLLLGAGGELLAFQASS